MSSTLESAKPIDDVPFESAPDIASLGDVLSFCRPALSERVLDAPGLAAVRRVADAIPAALSPFWGLETRLGDPAARADILWEVKRVSPGRQILAAPEDHEGPEADEIRRLVETAPLWRFLRDFTQRWRRGETPAGTALRNIWMEADTAATTAPEDLDARLAAPCLFWGADPTCAGADRALLNALPALAREAYGLEVNAALLTRLAESLPSTAVVFQLGAMGSRASPVARVCVKNLAVTAIPEWLAAIGWPGDLVRLRSLLDWLAPRVESIALNVDVTAEGVGAKLGLEIYQPLEALDLAPWTPIFSWLTEAGLAQGEKLAGLRRFPGHHRFYQSQTNILGARFGYPILIRNLHHLKLVVVGGEVVEAKAYLAVFRPAVNYASMMGTAESGEGDDGDAWLAG